MNKVTVFLRENPIIFVAFLVILALIIVCLVIIFSEHEKSREHYYDTGRVTSKNTNGLKGQGRENTVYVDLDNAHNMSKIPFTVSNELYQTIRVTLKKKFAIHYDKVETNKRVYYEIFSFEETDIP